jgi:(1->4)-alpha-D-glucan 1-alpha-D-glucosylmutase
MPVGVYADLAISIGSDGSEAWANQGLYALGVHVGAPPDELNRTGQDWGLPPLAPRRLKESGHEPLIATLRANMARAGALRIDHVMGLSRLWWVPAGMRADQGAYVRYPVDELLGIVALESHRNRCMVIGEDLGSVPDGLRARLRDGGLLSYRVLVYERHWQGDGQFCHPHEYPPQSLATVATHDMPTMTEFWCGDDIARRAQLGMYTGEPQRAEDATRRDGERAGMLRLLGELGLSPADPANAGDVIESLHAAIARTGSMLAVVQLDDLIGETEPVNIPGTYREYPNWRRKLALPIEEIFCDQRWSRLAAIMRAAGRASAASPA